MNTYKVDLLGLWLVVAYSLFYIATSFFSINSVLLQSIYNLFIIGIVMMLIAKIEISNPTLKPFLYCFWIGQAGLYIINYFLYSDVRTWLDNFNNYTVLLPIYVVSLLIGVWLAIKK